MVWRQALETYGFLVSRSKMEYIECKFSKRGTNSNSAVRIRDDTIPQVTKFNYFGFIIQNNGEIEGYVNHRI